LILLYTPAVDDPWLNDEQQRTWRDFLRLTGTLSDVIERDLQREAAMPHAYYQILAMLSEAPDRSMRMNQLAAVVRSSQSRLSHAVARLEQAGWVGREPVPGDGRGQVARLTEAGYRRLLDVAPGHARTVRTALFDALTDEQLAALDDICRTVLSALDARLRSDTERTSSR
jgi:DNA-binding MarR family transcriptional regulator